MKKVEPRDAFSRDVLEFDGIRGLLRGFLSSPLSEPRLAALEPHARLDEIRRALERVGEARDLLRTVPRPRLDQLEDPQPILERLRIEGIALAPLEILDLVSVARAARDFHTLFAKTPLPRLKELSSGLPDFRSLISELEGKVLPDGSVDSSASPQLARIRKDLERLRQELESTLEKILRRLSQDEVLQDDVVTIRDLRMVIPVRAEEKRRVSGVVHGASSSGATVYIEPLETVPLNNEIVVLKDREAAEVRRILGVFSQKLRERLEDLAQSVDILSEFDLAFAKAEFAREYDCSIPEFAAERALILKGVRHPLLEEALRGQGRRAVPLAIELREPTTMMVVSGPNAGGKTLALKAIGTAVLMAQSGLPVAAEEACLPLFTRVLADIGDQQSIQANLSTFSAHITNIQAMVEVTGAGDLVLLDEIGGSTEPHEGAALAMAILEHLRQARATTFVTTHYSRLKAYAAETREAVNAAMEFDEATLQPTYRLLIGLPGSSSALAIAARLGLDPSIVEKAREFLDPRDAEAASFIARLDEQNAELADRIAQLGREQGELESRKAALEQKFEQERRARLRELDARLEETIRQIEKKLETVLADLRAREGTAAAAKGLSRKGAALKREAREEWNAQVLETLGVAPEGEKLEEDQEPAVGDRVRVAGISTPGTVIALVGDSQIEVEVGRLRMRVSKGEVRVVARGSAPAPGPKAVLGASATAAVAVAEEIHVIGDSAEEARERVDKFLDQAYLAGRLRLRIIHGHGKGILKKTLHEMLASHPHVEKFYPAAPKEGGTGATIVELKI